LSLFHPPSAEVREILLLRRAKGYVRLQIPPLLYVRALALKLERALLELKGVRRVTLNPSLARLSVYYDPWIADDRAALLAIDRLATPLLARMEPEGFALALREQRTARLKRIGGKAVQVAYLGALLAVHLWLLRMWLRNPLRYWWAWGLIGFGIYTHRRQIRAAPTVSPERKWLPP
jgi:hypothetical protein